MAAAIMRHVHDIMLAGHGVQDKMEVQLTKNISILSLPCRTRTVDALAMLDEGLAEAAGFYLIVAAADGTMS